jgi:hypothetical protein
MQESAGQMGGLASQLRIVDSEITNKWNFPQDEKDPLHSLLKTLHEYGTTLESTSNACKQVTQNSQKLASQVSSVLDIFPQYLEALLKYNKRYHKNWDKIVELRKENQELDKFVTEVEKANNFSVSDKLNGEDGTSLMTPFVCSVSLVGVIVWNEEEESFTSCAESPLVPKGVFCSEGAYFVS